MTPEKGVEFNAAPLPPREYLMRRSYNPNDGRIPGAVVREWDCPEHGVSQAGLANAREIIPQCRHCGRYLDPHSVDVPLVKSDGSGWS